MPLFFMFTCTKCKPSAAIKGPQVLPNDTNNPKVGATFKSGVVPGVACPAKNRWHDEFAYTGKENLPPNAPPMIAKASNQPLLPTVWAQGADGTYTRQNKYSNIPDTAQTALIDVLGPILGDKDNRVPLLGASYDRFSDYADVEDAAVKAEGSDEKWLTLPLVLDRLDKIAGAMKPMDLWKQATISSQLGNHSAALMLPSGVDGGKFHAELLRDMVNPRGGHSVAADTYAQAIKKAIALRKANAAGNSVQGTKRSYYFYSTRSKRGLAVVLTNDGYVLTVYYAGNATWWWNGNVPPDLRLARTVA
jgi:hypothetical protein